MIEPPAPFVDLAPTELPIDTFGSAIFTSGYRPAYGRLLPWPEAFDDLGFPIQVDGSSSVIDGLFFVGVHFLRKRKSALLYGVGEDAAIVAQAVALRSPGPSHRRRRPHGGVTAPPS